MVPARIVGIVLMLLSSPAYARGEAELCDIAATSAAHYASMPVDVLRALTLVETGRNRGGQFEPWPWTVNMEGQGHWFATRAQAVEFVSTSYAAGARSFDVGCFQINHRWHGQAFSSFEQMFEPAANAAYAAEFMSSLFKERGSWSWAAGAYHSRTESLAKKYRTRFDRIIANLPATKEEPPIVVASNDAAAARLSSWNILQPINMVVAPAKNGSLATGLASHTNPSLLNPPVAALF